MLHDKTRCAIVIRAKNGHEMTQRCIRSLYAATPLDSFVTILVDDGSDTDMCGLDYDYYIRCSESHGAVTASNLGIQIAIHTGLPYTLILDNDTTFPDGDHGWLDRMIDELEEFPATACVGATTNFANPPQHILSSPATYTGKWEDAKRGAAGGPENPAVRWFVSFCVLFKTDLLAKLGPWDERFNPGNWEDTDFSVRIRESGHEIRVARSVYVHHEGHKTFSDKLQMLLAVNRGKFVEKWGPGRLCDLGFMSYEDLVKPKVQA